MVTIGTPLSPTARKVLLLGSGELGKELVIELQRLGVEVIAVDRYPNAPAMQVDPQTYEVRADGQLLTCEPARVLPMAQRYFLF